MLLFKNQIAISLFLLLGLINASYAAIYFTWGAEDFPCDGRELSNPPFYNGVAETRGHVVCEASPEGSRHIEFITVDNQNNHRTNVNSQGLPLTNIMGKTLYLAYFFNFTRIDNLDIWHETGQSADKGFEFYGNGIRWILARGHWTNCNNSGGVPPNLDQHYSVWVGNPTYHLNRSLEAFFPNQNGYSCTNLLQLKYDSWHAAVMKLNVQSDNTGSVAVWIDGVKVIEYNNIRTAANNNPTIDRLQFGGTIAQPAYDSPSHKRKYDAILLTDTWQDIVDGGYIPKMPKPPEAY